MGLRSNAALPLLVGRAELPLRPIFNCIVGLGRAAKAHIIIDVEDVEP